MHARLLARQARTARFIQDASSQLEDVQAALGDVETSLREVRGRGGSSRGAVLECTQGLGQAQVRQEEA